MFPPPPPEPKSWRRQCRIPINQKLITNLYYRNISDLPFYSPLSRITKELFASFDAHRHLFLPLQKCHISSNFTTVVNTKCQVIAHKWRATGLARTIMKHRLAMCRAAGVAAVLKVVNNPRAQYLLSSSGFEVVCETDFRAAIEQDGVDWKPKADDPQTIQLTDVLLRIHVPGPGVRYSQSLLV